MISEQDRVYFEQRLAEELERAAGANLPEVAAAHRELAQRYQALLDRGVVPTPELVS